MVKCWRSLFYSKYITKQNTFIYIHYINHIKYSINKALKSKWEKKLTKKKKVIIAKRQGQGQCYHCYAVLTAGQGQSLLYIHSFISSFHNANQGIVKAVQKHLLASSNAQEEHFFKSFNLKSAISFGHLKKQDVSN